MINKCDDNLLLQKIALKKDHDAFQELYRRYDRYAFSIALRILGKRSLAEEAVQEAFLGIWSSASSYRPDKNHRPRHWIMRIIVNKCLRLDQTQQRLERNAKKETDLSCDRAPADAPEELEHAELLTALHQKLSQVPAESRLVLTLFYGAGMSQKEIAETVSMPPRTVSFKIQETLKWLRGELTKAKFGGVVPALGTEVMREACSDGYLPSPKLQERVFKNLANIANVPSAAKLSGTFPKAAVFMACGLIATLCIAVGVNEFTVKPTQTTTSAIKTTSTPLKLLRRWDFNQPDLSDLNQIEGTWKHLPQGGPDGSGCMRIGDQSKIHLGLNIPITELPIRLQFKVKFGPDKPDLMITWGRQNHRITLKAFQLGKVHTKKTWITSQCFVSKQGFEFWRNDTRVSVNLAQATHQSELVLRLGKSAMIDDLEIHQVHPTSLKDSIPYFQAAEKFSSNQPNIPRLLPSLCSRPTSTLPNGNFWQAFSPNTPEFSGTKSRTWKFNSPDDLLDFAVTEGKWKHIPKGGKNGTGCVEIAKGNFNALFNLNAEQYPFLITARFNIIDPLRGFPEIMWLPNDAPITAHFINAFANPTIMVNPAKPWITIKLYVTSEYIDYWAQNRRVALAYNPKRKGAYGSITAREASQMDLLSIRPIRLAQLPNLGPFLAAIKKIRSSRKSYTFPLPDLTSPTPGKKIFVKINVMNERSINKKRKP